MDITVIDIKPRPEDLTYYPFTDTMWRCTRHKINAIKIWREMHKLAPLAHDMNCKPVVPSLRSAKKVVEEMQKTLSAQGQYEQKRVGITCRVSEDYETNETGYLERRLINNE